MGRTKAEWRVFAERLDRIKAAKNRGDVSVLLAALTDPDHRGCAAKFLADLGAEQAIRPIRRLLGAADSSVRMDAAMALGKLRARDAAPRLRELAKQDQNKMVRAWASHALAEMEDPEAFDVALPLLRDPSGWVRLSAAVTLGKIGDPRAIAPLRAARPRLLRSPLKWDAFHRAYGTSIASLKRRAVGSRLHAGSTIGGFGAFSQQHGSAL